MLQIALAWQLQLPYISSPIIGANTVGQLQESLGATVVKLATEDVLALETASAWT